jgi:hypothetical protein
VKNVWSGRKQLLSVAVPLFKPVFAVGLRADVMKPGAGAETVCRFCLGQGAINGDFTGCVTRAFVSTLVTAF